MGEKKLLTTEELFIYKKQIAQWLEAGLRALVSQKDKLSVQVTDIEEISIFEIDLAEKDFGRIVGSRGKTISSFRVIVAALCATHDFRGKLEIKNEDRFFEGAFSAKRNQG